MTRVLVLARINPCVVASAVASALLSACVSMSGLGGESKYACAAPEGVTCQSVSGTYANAIRNGASATRLPAATNASSSAAHSSQPSRALQLQRPTQTAPITTATGGVQVPGPAAVPQPNRRDVEPHADAAEAALAMHRPAPLPADALRDPPRILRLWTKAWEDADGDLWDEGVVYVQVSSGSWRIDHVRQSARRRAATLHPPPVGASASAKAGHITRQGPTQSWDAEAPRSGRSQFGPFPTIVPTLPLAAEAAISPPADRSTDRSGDRSSDRSRDSARDRPSDNSQ